MNNLKINATDTPKMVISFSKVAPDIPCIVVNGTILQGADTVKLAGVQLPNDLSWGHHVEFIVKKSRIRFVCMNMLKRAKMRAKDIMIIFCLKIRPILGYAAQVWHPGHSMEQSRSHWGCPIKELALPTPAKRRVELCNSSFDKIQTPKDKLFRIVPPIQDNIKTLKNIRNMPYQSLTWIG